MKIERTKVEFPIWRKKVDSSLFQYKGTTIPKWVCGIWNIEKVFSGKGGKGNPESEVKIKFGSSKHKGWVTVTWPKKRASKVFRLWFDDELDSLLKETYLMSFMRDIEGRLRAKNKIKSDIEEEIPFWEFLDIEFDYKARQFIFTPYYIQKPEFTELFKRLAHSPPLKKIYDELLGKSELRIYKQDWKPREEFETELGAVNVIYTLIDTKKKHIYIGEAENLIKRLSSGHKTIPRWSHYRYNNLPKNLSSHRVAIERMIIRDFAALFNNKKDIKSVEISDYQLVNEKIDR